MRQRERELGGGGSRRPGRAGGPGARPNPAAVSSTSGRALLARRAKVKPAGGHTPSAWSSSLPPVGGQGVELATSSPPPLRASQLAGDPGRRADAGGGGTGGDTGPSRCLATTACGSLGEGGRGA